MTEGQRLREQLQRVGDAKASTRADDDASHLALTPGERLQRVVQLSDTLRSLSIAAGKTTVVPDDAEAWVRVYRHLHHAAGHG